MPSVRFDGENSGDYKPPRSGNTYQNPGTDAGFGVPNDSRSGTTFNDGGTLFDPAKGYANGGFAGGYQPTVQPNFSQGQPIAPQHPYMTYDPLGSDPSNKQVYRGSDGNMYTDGQGMNGFVSYAGPGVGGAATQKPGGGNLLDPKYVDSLLAYYGNQPGVNPSVKNDPNYWRGRIMSGAFGNDEGYLVKRFFTPEGAPEGGGSQGPGVFDDPATKQWEQVLQGLAGKMAQPFTPAGFGPLQDYLGKYFQQLQGPAYTPEQTALMHTQAVEPLTQERDAQRQRQLQNFSQRGIGPGSGIAQDQMNQLDRQYEQLRSVRERDLAVGAVNQQNQNRQQAAQVGSQLAGLQTQLQSANESRALHGLDLLRQIPALADSRLQLALGSLGQNNPNAGALFGNLAQFNQQAQNQQTNNQNYWNQIGQLITSIFT